MSETQIQEAEIIEPDAKQEAPVLVVTQSQPPARERRTILGAMALRYHMEADTFQQTVRRTCFPSGLDVTREEFAACMLIAYKLGLNPVTREVHFARNKKTGGIQTLIGVDGWYMLANRSPEYDGCEFTPRYDSSDNLIAMSCKIFRKDRSHATEVEELLSECRRDSEAWKLTPSRMLRHRAFGQCARIAFSFAGIMDEDEYARWQEHGSAIGSVTQQQALAPPTAPKIPFDIFASPGTLPVAGDAPPPAADHGIDDQTVVEEEGTSSEENALVDGFRKALSEAICPATIATVETEISKVAATISDDARWTLVDAVMDAKQRVNS
jgi:hypothetical protein